MKRLVREGVNNKFCDFMGHPTSRLFFLYLHLKLCDLPTDLIIPFCSIYSNQADLITSQILYVSSEVKPIEINGTSSQVGKPRIAVLALQIHWNLLILPHKKPHKQAEN